MSTAAEALSGNLTFATVPKELERLRPRVAQGGALTIDLSQVPFADSAGISLLLELSREAKTGGCTLRYVGASEQLRGLVRFFGLDDWLALEPAK